MEIYLLKQDASNQQLQWDSFFELAEAYALLGRNADAYASVSGWEDGGRSGWLVGLLVEGGEEGLEVVFEGGAGLHAVVEDAGFYIVIGEGDLT